MAKVNSHPNQPPVTVTKPEPFLPPELLDRFLDVQQQEIRLRTDELSLRTQQDKHNKEIAEKSITANLEDREHERSHARTMTKMVLAASTALALIVAIVICYSLYSGKDAVAMEIIKALIFVFTGGAGGYALGARTKRKEETRIAPCFLNA